MRLIIPLEQATEDAASLVGNKAVALSALMRTGVRAPRGLCLTTRAYREHLRRTGLGTRILLELNRKAFEDMRWEEMWDAALRIRSMFLNTPLAEGIRDALLGPLAECFAEEPTVVRSSAPGEDSAATSFAGLHESYVNVRGAEAILEHVKLVWASLWSDAALLYRQKLKLDVAKSAMAVVVQVLRHGEKSGVVFGQSPNDPAQAIVESVHGLNQGLVDGSVEPDRWVLERATGRVLSHAPAKRESLIAPTTQGTSLQPLDAERAQRPPLSEAEVTRVFDLARSSEDLFGAPQDVEWTFCGDALFALQSRPVTTRPQEDPMEKRSNAWYLTLRRSFDNLKALRRRIEAEEIPAMLAEADALSRQDLIGLADADLAAEIVRRQEATRRWTAVYWEDFIPFAHGARLFGKIYNDTLRPEDPYEFVALLGGTKMTSLDRNQRLEAMAQAVRENPACGEGDALRAQLEDFMNRYGGALGDPAAGFLGREEMLRLVREMATRPPRAACAPERDVHALTTAFLDHFEGDARSDAEELLDLARASWRLRDDDNVFLGRVEAQEVRAIEEARRRLAQNGCFNAPGFELPPLESAVKSHARAVRGAEDAGEPIPHDIRARQLVGQPAGPGLAVGKARVVESADDLKSFRQGDVLVCDAIDPRMTFVVPLASAVVERRGGMLIHGAIIAREYGLPCVTGVPDATRFIHTGDTLSVDGTLGIVVITSRATERLPEDTP